MIQVRVSSPDKAIKGLAKDISQFVDGFTDDLLKNLKSKQRATHQVQVRHLTNLVGLVRAGTKKQMALYKIKCHT